MASFPPVIVLAPTLSRTPSIAAPVVPPLAAPLLYLSQQLTKLRNDAYTSDVLIEVKEGTPVMCQSLLLTIACPLLAGLFYTNDDTPAAKETFAREFKGSVTMATHASNGRQQWRVAMPNTSRQVVTALLDTIYDGVIHIPLSATLLRECIHMAATLKSAVFDMTLTSAFKAGFESMNEAEFRGFLDPSLSHLRAVQEHIGRFAFKYLPAAQFNTLDCKQVITLAANDALEWTELKFFESCVGWATERAKAAGDTSSTALRTLLDPILPHIRFTTMNISELSSGVAPHNILSSEEIVALFGYVSVPADQRDTEMKLPFNTNPRVPAWNDLVAPSPQNRFTLLTRRDRFWFRNAANGGHLSTRHDGHENDWSYRTRDIISTQDHSGGPASQNDWETLRFFSCATDTPVPIDDVNMINDGSEVIIESDELGWLTLVEISGQQRIVARAPSARKVADADTWLLHKVRAVGGGDAWQIVHKASRRVITAHTNHTVTAEAASS